MEKLNGMIQKMSLKKALLSISAVSIILIAALSVVTIFLLLNLNQKILNTRPITIRNSDIQYEAGEKEEGDSLQYKDSQTGSVCIWKTDSGKSIEI